MGGFSPNKTVLVVGQTAAGGAGIAPQPKVFTRKSKGADGGIMKCVNCGCLQTPLWRRGPSGEQLCNACGIYFKNHRTHRPMPVKMKHPIMSKKSQFKAQRNKPMNAHPNKQTKRPTVKKECIHAVSLDLLDVLAHGVPMHDGQQILAAARVLCLMSRPQQVATV